MIRRGTWLTIAAVVLWAGSLCLGNVAEAQDPPVPARVNIILASELPGLIDPRLENVAGLRRSPFNRYSSMTLLSSPELQLRVGHPEVVDLPNGRRMRLELQARTPEGRYRIQVSVNRPGQQDYLPAARFVVAPGSPIFVAGQSFEAGTLVIGVTLANAR